MIDARALVHANACLADDVEVGPFSVIGADVEIGAGSVVASHVVIEGPTRIGKGNPIFQFSPMGEDATDRKYRGEPRTPGAG